MNRSYDRVENRKQKLYLYLLLWFKDLLLIPCPFSSPNITLSWSPFRYYTIPTLIPAYRYTCMHMYIARVHIWGRTWVFFFPFWIWVTVFSTILYKIHPFSWKFYYLICLYSWIIFCFENLPCFHYPFRWWLSARSVPYPKQSCNKHEYTNVSGVWLSTWPGVEELDRMGVLFWSFNISPVFLPYFLEILRFLNLYAYVFIIHSCISSQSSCLSFLSNWDHRLTHTS